MRIHYLQHEAFEDPGMIRQWAAARNFSLTSTLLYQAGAEDLPNIQSLDALVIMGGSMGVYDEAEYPWLTPEKLFIEQAIQAGKLVLGICLGAQLIAAVLGAKVTRNKHREIGWFPIEFSTAAVKHPILNGIASILTVFHWHGYRFAIPEGAIPLAVSFADDFSLYRYNDRILGLQFHLEMDDSSIAAMLDAGTDSLTGNGFVQNVETIKAFQAGDSTRSVLFTLLDNWLGQRGPT